MAAIAAWFAMLPPVTGFAAYFLLVHSPRHMIELARRRDPANPCRGLAWVLRAALPLTAASDAVEALLYAGLDGAPEERFLRIVYWGLAALTVPHVVLHHLDAAWGVARLR